MRTQTLRNVTSRGEVSGLIADRPRLPRLRPNRPAIPLGDKRDVLVSVCAIESDTGVDFQTSHKKKIVCDFHHPELAELALVSGPERDAAGSSLADYDLRPGSQDLRRTAQNSTPSCWGTFMRGCFRGLRGANEVPCLPRVLNTLTVHLP